MLKSCKEINCDICSYCSLNCIENRWIKLQFLILGLLDFLTVFIYKIIIWTSWSSESPSGLNIMIKTFSSISWRLCLLRRIKKLWFHLFCIFQMGDAWCRPVFLKILCGSLPSLFLVSWDLIGTIFTGNSFKISWGIYMRPKSPLLENADVGYYIWGWLSQAHLLP